MRLKKSIVKTDNLLPEDSKLAIKFLYNVLYGYPKNHIEAFKIKKQIENLKKKLTKGVLSAK